MEQVTGSDARDEACLADFGAAKHNDIVFELAVDLFVELALVIVFPDL